MLTTSQYIRVVNHYVVYLTYSYMSIILKKKKKKEVIIGKNTFPTPAHTQKVEARQDVDEESFLFSVTFLLFQFL